MERGLSFLAKDREKAYDVFVDRVNHGVYGLCITRINPKKVRKRYGLKYTPVVWLTGRALLEEKTVANIQDLSIVMSDFLERTKRSIILLDGLEWLTIIHNFEMVYKFVQDKRDQVSQENANLIIPVNPDAMDKRHLALLESELEILNF